MKKILLTLFTAALSFAGNSYAQTHTLVKKWQTDTLLKTPESVLYDAKAQILYVSNIDGAPDGRDGKGSVGKVGLDGKIIAVDWVKGLNAPKGMGLYKGKLYVADLTEVAVIDVAKAQIEKRIPVEGSVFLNDITVDKEGTVYVSDTRNFKVYRIDKNHNVFKQIENLQGPNGLLALGNDLLILDKGRLLKMSANGGLATLSEGMDPSTDGVEMVKENEYVVSCWSGIIYYVSANGNKQTLLDTRNEKWNTADIGYDAKNRIVYVPTFYKNCIVAYQLK